MPVEVGAVRLPFARGEEREVRAAIAEHGVGFTVDEARALARLLGRDPTLVEAHLFSTMWSEHCSYKSSRPLLKKYLPVDSPFVVLAFTFAVCVIGAAVAAFLTPRHWFSASVRDGVGSVKQYGLDTMTSMRRRFRPQTI